MDNVKELNEQEFIELVKSESKPILVDFWASWCMPCKMQAPVFHECADQLFEKAVFVKINVDECASLCNSLKINSIPTIMLFVGGKVESVKVGMQSKANLSEMLINFI